MNESVEGGCRCGSPALEAVIALFFNWYFDFYSGLALHVCVYYLTHYKKCYGHAFTFPLQFFKTLYFKNVLLKFVFYREIIYNKNLNIFFTRFPSDNESY